ncbi:MAG: hypothetical protein PHE12_03010 [Clostridia bacterium]|nr:hypothetical protein [Clostridia bacterium]
MFESNNQPQQQQQQQPQPQQYQYYTAPPVNNRPKNIIHYNVKVPPRPKHSIFLHIILFCMTGGIGNVLYLIYKIYEQNKWDEKYNK